MSNARRETALASAWREASNDLGFEFISPFTFADLSGGLHGCSGLVVHVGSVMGALVVSQYDDDPNADIIGAELGFFSSALNPLHYERYDRAVFLETLLDWGWYGPVETRPAWYELGTGT
jgi:hypothetical protein